MIRKLKRWMQWFLQPEVLPPPDRSCMRQAEMLDALWRRVAREERQL